MIRHLPGPDVSRPYEIVRHAAGANHYYTGAERHIAVATPPPVTRKGVIMHRFTRQVLVAASCLTLSIAAFAKPPVFSDTSYADAIKANATDGKLLIIKGTAEWCGPCKQMDKTTWVDATVVQFVKDNGVAIAVDVDELPDVAKTLGIEAMPTMIVFKDGKELDRVVGMQTADKLLAWLENAKAGKTRAVMLREKAGNRVGPDGKVDIESRMEVARGLLDARDFATALDEYVWLWDNMLEHDDAYTAVRGSFLASEIQQLAARHEPAKVKFTAMRDALAAKLKERRSFEAFLDWMALNEVVGDKQATLAWFDRVKNDDNAKAWIERAWFRIEKVLEEEGRWTDLGAKVNVSQFLSMQRMMANARDRAPAQANPEMEARMRDMRDRMTRNEFAKTHMALLAAGREEDGRRVADELVKDLDDEASCVALVTVVVDNGLARDWHTVLLDDADAKAPNTINERVELRRRLERALKAAK